ncbi:MAG: MoaD/ThiS family protein [Alphaproteobacteria bacterium]|nr:MoaD/ThiS family protein [Alphaproteobacteria bacterium]MCB9797662.1 MoaD/ThiS family protein [Alphaproteobacteria bacterium]
MPHVNFTRHLQRFFPTLEAGEVPGATVRELVQELDRRHPGLASYITDETGRVRRHVNIFVGEEPIWDREALSDPLAPDAKVFILQALSGG